MPTGPIDPADLPARLLAVERTIESLKNLVFRHGYKLYGEGWHTVGAAGEPAFQNAFVASTPPPQFYKDSNGRVHLRGRVTRAGDTANTPFTLPLGYRPDVTAGNPAAFAVMANSNATGWVMYRLNITDAGLMLIATVGNGIAAVNSIILDGITFRAPLPH